MLNDGAGAAQLKPRRDFTLGRWVAIVINIRDYAFQHLSLTSGGSGGRLRSVRYHSRTIGEGPTTVKKTGSSFRGQPIIIPPLLLKFHRGPEPHSDLEPVTPDRLSRSSRYSPAATPATFPSDWRYPVGTGHQKCRIGRLPVKPRQISISM